MPARTSEMSSLRPFWRRFLVVMAEAPKNLCSSRRLQQHQGLHLQGTPSGLVEKYCIPFSYKDHSGKAWAFFWVPRNHDSMKTCYISGCFQAEEVQARMCHRCPGHSTLRDLERTVRDRVSKFKANQGLLGVCCGKPVFICTRLHKRTTL